MNKHLQSVVLQLTKSIGIARKVSHRLSPTFVVQGSLSDALKGFAASLGSARLLIHLDPEIDTIPIGQPARDCVFQLACDCVTDSLGRSSCAQVQLSLRRQVDRIEVEIVNIESDAAAAHSATATLLSTYNARIIGATIEEVRLAEDRHVVRIAFPISGLEAAPRLSAPPECGV
jgi:hypothetical protein